MKTGWICPVCGAGVAPDVKRCDCVGKDKIKGASQNIQFNGLKEFQRTANEYAKKAVEEGKLKPRPNQCISFTPDGPIPECCQNCPHPFLAFCMSCTAVKYLMSLDAKNNQRRLVYISENGIAP